MKLIIKPRQSGKTSELIRMSEETNACILTPNWIMAEYTAEMAKKQGHDIPYPIALNDYMRTGLRDSNVRHILIDNADIVLQKIFSEYVRSNGVTIDAITMSSEKPERFSSEWHKVYMEGWTEGRRKLVEAMERELAW